MKKDLLFLTLNTFSATGGIEKVCRAAGKALHDIALENGERLRVYAMHDGADAADEAYLPATAYKGFAGQRINFALESIRQGRKARVVVLSHVNLLPVGYLIKKASPKTKLVLIAHGIEVWEGLTGLKKKLLPAVDLFLPVSAFTAAKLQALHKVAAEKIRVLNNCLDPFIQNESNPSLEAELRERYGIAEGDSVLLTVTRLKFSEQYKGYDKVVEALKTVRQSYPQTKYLIVGKYDKEERERLGTVIDKHGLADAVIFAGFVKDEEMNAHFKIADMYVMPSTGEGFGIVFIEALFYGLPVIAGNVDGSVDALANGQFGLLVNPDQREEIVTAIEEVFANINSHKPLKKKVLGKFGFDAYKNNWQDLVYADRMPGQLQQLDTSKGLFAVD